MDSDGIGDGIAHCGIRINRRRRAGHHVRVIVIRMYLHTQYALLRTSEKRAGQGRPCRRILVPVPFRPPFWFWFGAGCCCLLLATSHARQRCTDTTLSGPLVERNSFCLLLLLLLLLFRNGSNAPVLIDCNVIIMVRLG